MPRGYDHPLYIMPFDHRGSFQTKMFGWQSPLSGAQTAEIAGAKRVIYDGFLAALAGGVPREKAGILVDEQFGATILRDAMSKNIVTACALEKSGQPEFDFEFGEDFASHIEAFDPTFGKVLVRYNPDGDRALNKRQATRLKRLSDFLAARGRSRFMFELLVPPEKMQLDRLKGNRETYDLELKTTPLRDPEHYQYDFDLADIAEVWRRGSVIASWLLDLTATSLVQDPALSKFFRARLRFGRRPLDDQGGHRRGRAGACALVGAL
jgi:myo-inositol catabolism protein IolC